MMLQTTFPPPHFPETTRASLRRELEMQGVCVDGLLARESRPSVFGLNLACAWPFSGSAAEAYARLGTRLEAVPGLYVYRPADTHITLVTLLSFHQHQEPSRRDLEFLVAIASRATAVLRDALNPIALRAFELVAEPLVLTRRACLLPWGNPTGEIAVLRERVCQILAGAPALHMELQTHGLNIPGIVHSTVGRFVSAENARAVGAAFDAATANPEPMTLRIEEILITAETKPYMTEGHVRHRFVLNP